MSNKKLLEFAWRCYSNNRDTYVKQLNKLASETLDKRYLDIANDVLTIKWLNYSIYVSNKL